MQPGALQLVIEITPEMLAAGRRAFWAHDADEVGSDHIVAEIFVSMLTQSNALTKRSTSPANHSIPSVTVMPSSSVGDSKLTLKVSL